jgi:hypothetical protein
VLFAGLSFAMDEEEAVATTPLPWGGRSRDTTTTNDFYVLQDDENSNEEDNPPQSSNPVHSCLSRIERAKRMMVFILNFLS